LGQQAHSSILLPVPKADPQIVMSTSTHPLFRPRLGALFMSFAFGVIAGGLGLYSLIESNREQSKAKKETAPPIEISFHINDIFQPGVVATTICSLIALVSFTILLLFFLPTRGPGPHIATRTLRMQAAIFAFCDVWLLATAIPYTYTFATKSTGIDASIDGLAVPASAIATLEKENGLNPAYSSYGYVRHAVITCWIALLFGTAVVPVLLAAHKRAAQIPATAALVPPPLQDELKGEQAYKENADEASV